jgi:cobalt-zinc-cadmium efflux system outer membrane protein
LPLFDRNQGAVLEARAELAAATAELTLRQSRVLGELVSALEAVRATKHQVESLETAFIDRADQSLEVALAAYREGAASLLLVIDAERARNTAQELMVEALNDHRVALHELERATGLMALPTETGVAAEVEP